MYTVSTVSTWLFLASCGLGEEESVFALESQGFDSIEETAVWVRGRGQGYRKPLQQQP